jgi:GT2 family glycosyltransferase
VTAPPPEVSFVIPVYNGERWIVDAIEAIEALERGPNAAPIEIIAIDDRSSDRSRAILEGLAADGRVRLLDGEGRGASAAINVGIRAARGAIICQIDQDVIVEPRWLVAVQAALRDPAVAAAQGCYLPAPDASLWATLMGLDLLQRYDAIAGDAVDHVCTGNVAYRAAALREVGLFDETLGYGYDNDMSYRLVAAGHRLVIARTATAIHRWRETLPGYLRQQYGVGYGRLDLVAKHPRRHTGDEVSRAFMMAHAPLMLLALTLAGLALALTSVDALWGRVPAILAALIVAVLAVERGVAGIIAAVRFRRWEPLAFPLAHLLRDVAWAAAVVVWSTRWLRRIPPRPRYSMWRDDD